MENCSHLSKRRGAWTANEGESCGGIRNSDTGLTPRKKVRRGYHGNGEQQQYVKEASSRDAEQNPRLMNFSWWILVQEKNQTMVTKRSQISCDFIHTITIMYFIHLVQLRTLRLALLVLLDMFPLVQIVCAEGQDGMRGKVVSIIRYLKIWKAVHLKMSGKCL